MNRSFNETDPNFGNGVFDDAWYAEHGKLREESIRILKTETRNRPELKEGWRPITFNFTRANTKKFLEEFKDHDKPYPFDLVYDEIKTRYETDFGSGEPAVELADVIDKYIL